MDIVIYQVLLWQVPFVLFIEFLFFSIGYCLGQRCEILEEEKRAAVRKNLREYLEKQETVK